MNLVNILKNIGLTEKEARVYLAGVELGESPVSLIAEKAQINRVTAYSVLEKLIDAGLINTITKQGMRYFDATPPHLLFREHKKRLAEFGKALPTLKALRGEARFPHVQYFDNMEGIKKIYAETLNSKTEIFNFSDSKSIRDHWPEYDEEYVAERVKRRVKLKGICPKDKYGIKVQAADRTSLREIRLIPPSHYHFTNEINIWDDKVAIISFNDKPPIGILIQSQEIANTQRAIFKLAWSAT